jgi:hypothetical protein
MHPDIPEMPVVVVKCPVCGGEHLTWGTVQFRSGIKFLKGKQPGRFRFQDVNPLDAPRPLSQLKAARCKTCRYLMIFWDGV